MPPYKLDPTSWQIRDWKEIAWESVNADSLVCPTSAFVFHLAIFSNGSGEADGQIFDATSLLSTGKHVDLYCADEEMDGLAFWPPLYFSQGIYVDVGTNVDRIFVQYLPWHS